MIDLGTQLISQGISVGMFYRVEPREAELPARISSAFRIEVPVGPTPELRTLLFLLHTATKLFAARSRFDICHLVVPQPMTAVAAAIAKILDRPIVATVFAPYPEKGSKLANYLHLVSERAVLRLADVVVFECEATRRTFRSQDGIVIFNGIDTSYYYPDTVRRDQLRSKFGIEPKAIVVLYVGRIAENKGIRDLLEAFASLPSAYLEKTRLVLVGPFEAKPSDFIPPALSLTNRVLLIGPVGKDQVRDYYQLSDAFVLPSYQEGISSSLVEAASCALPAVVSNVGGNPEVVIDGENGFVMEAGDVDGLRASLIKLIDDKQLRQAMSRQARERIKARFDIKAMTQQYLKVYLDLLRKGQ